jgi:hypothetical protein
MPNFINVPRKLTGAGTVERPAAIALRLYAIALYSLRAVLWQFRSLLLLLSKVLNNSGFLTYEAVVFLMFLLLFNPHS